MFHKSKALLLCILCAELNVALAEVLVSDYQPLSWTERLYKAQAPAPFGPVVFRISQTTQGDTTAITINFGGATIRVDDDYYGAFSDPSEVEVAYSDPRFADSQTIEYIDFIFEAGDSYWVTYDFPERSDRVLERDLVRIRLRADSSLEVSVFNMQSINEDET